MYSPAGAKIGVTGQTLAVGRIPLPGGAIASYGSGGLNNYAHADWLGSTRFSSYAASRTMKWDLAHAPYGEVYALTGGGAEFTFTGQFSDYGTTNTLWDFPMREYHSSQGRWISPDLAGLAAVNPMNPQTWNRYAYVGGMPLNLVDALGLDGETYTYGGGGPGTITDYTSIDVFGGDVYTGAAGGGGGDRYTRAASSLGFHQENGSFLSQLGSLHLANNGSWWSALKHSPWVVSWILPLGPVPGVAGVGPAGSFAWNPATKTLCGSIGAGASVGDNLAGGPVTGRTLNGQQATPSQSQQNIQRMVCELRF
jgi:RHS repeat-associated protein